MGTRPVTLCTAQWADVPFDELCVLAKKMGYDGLEVACWGEGIDIDKALTDDSYVAWIKDNLAKNGLVMKAWPAISSASAWAICPIRAWTTSRPRPSPVSRKPSRSGPWRR